MCVHDVQQVHDYDSVSVPSTKNAISPKCGSVGRLETENMFGVALSKSLFFGNLISWFYLYLALCFFQTESIILNLWQ